MHLIEFLTVSMSIVRVRWELSAVFHRVALKSFVAMIAWHIGRYYRGIDYKISTPVMVRSNQSEELDCADVPFSQHCPYAPMPFSSPSSSS